MDIDARNVLVVNFDKHKTSTLNCLETPISRSKQKTVSALDYLKFWQRNLEYK